MSFADKTAKSEKLHLIKILYPVSIASHVHVYVLRICICVYELEYLSGIRVICGLESSESHSGLTPSAAPEDLPLQSSWTRLSRERHFTTNDNTIETRIRTTNSQFIMTLCMARIIAFAIILLTPFQIMP